MRTHELIPNVVCPVTNVKCPSYKHNYIAMQDAVVHYCTHVDNPKSKEADSCTKELCPISECYPPVVTLDSIRAGFTANANDFDGKMTEMYIFVEAQQAELLKLKQLVGEVVKALDHFNAIQTDSIFHNLLKEAIK